MNWTPVRRGNVYCSPACGAGCTFAAYKEAGKKAEKLITLLATTLGGAWKIEVHENLAWHYKAVSTCDRWMVTQIGPKFYMAWLKQPNAAGSRWTGTGSTPAAAVKDAWECYMVDLESMGHFLSANPANMKGQK